MAPIPSDKEEICEENATMASHLAGAGGDFGLVEWENPHNALQQTCRRTHIENVWKVMVVMGK